MPYKTTEAQRASSKRRRERMRAEYRCTQCGTQDERTLAGRKLCSVCAAKKAEYEYTKRQDRTDQHREYLRRWRENCRAEHRCTGCGRPLPEGDPHITCATCREKKMKWHREIRMQCELTRGLSEKEKLQICLDCPYSECVEGGD